MSNLYAPFHRNERGALSVVGVFMVLLLVALLYALLGVSETLTAREGMQDAADSASYSRAIMHARGMNLIAFINLLMAALISILIALRLAQTALLVVTGALLAFAWAGGVTAPIAAQTSLAAQQLGSLYSQAKNYINPTLERLHQVQEVVSVVVPYVALADSAAEAAQHHPPALGAVSLPDAMSLPVEPDDFPVLCKHGAQFAAKTALEAAMFPLGEDVRGKFSSFIPDTFTENLGTLAEKTSGFLCGKGGSSPPQHTEIEHWRLPRPDGFDSCEAEPKGDACSAATKELEASESAREWDGSCLHSCHYNEPYEKLARRARVSCDPRIQHHLSKFTYQTRIMHTTWTFIEGEWRETKREPRPANVERLVENAALPPCGPTGTISDEEWNSSSGPPSQKFPTPLCSTPIELPTLSANEGDTFTQTVTDVTRIFSCTQTLSKTYELGSKGDQIDGGDKKAPFRVEPDSKLGSEAFLIRTLAFGAGVGPNDTSKKGVRLASLSAHGSKKKSALGRLNDVLSELAANSGNVSVAQSEYYFDHGGNVDAKDWMWDMRWTARLARFRMPTEEQRVSEEQRQKKRAGRDESIVDSLGGFSDNANATDQCSRLGVAGCDTLEEKADFFSSLVIH